VADLLRAEIAPKNICDAVEVTLKTVYNVKQAIAARKGTNRKSGRGGANKKRTSEFLDAFQAK